MSRISLQIFLAAKLYYKMLSYKFSRGGEDNYNVESSNSEDTKVLKFKNNR